MPPQSWWLQLRSSAFRDVPFVFLGLFIGWNCDFSCVVKGTSMFPTLRPGEYLLFVPYSLLVIKRLIGAPLIHAGDVVVVKISDELSVCKRATMVTPSAQEAKAWEEQHFTDIDPAYYAQIEPPSRDDLSWYEALARSTKTRDWERCVDRVPNPSGWLWLEGDNPDESLDSRTCGAVPIECLRGRVVGVAWPEPRRVGLKLTG